MKNKKIAFIYVKYWSGALIWLKKTKKKPKQMSVVAPFAAQCMLCEFNFRLSSFCLCCLPEQSGPQPAFALGYQFEKSNEGTEIKKSSHQSLAQC